MVARYSGRFFASLSRGSAGPDTRQARLILAVLMLLALVPTGMPAAFPEPVSAANTPRSTPIAGTVTAWGDNSRGVFGNGTTANSAVPVSVSNLTGVTAIAAGQYRSLALKGDGTVLASGASILGNGTTTDSTVPVSVSNLGGVIAIAAGMDHSLALKGDGTVMAWGINEYGALGNGTTTLSYTPTPVSNLGGVTAIDANWLFSLALKSDGTVMAWGNNTYGQLGNGANVESDVPVAVSNLGGVIAIAAGQYHSLALKGDGTVMAWGANPYGELGNGTSMDSNVPVPVGNLTGVVAVAAGDNYSLALKGDGTVMAWGYNGYGQLGNGTTTNSAVPAPVSNLSGIRAISAGDFHALALKGDGTVMAWGNNIAGALGNGTTTDSAVPVPVSNLTGVTAISAGRGYSVGLSASTPTLTSIAVTPATPNIAVGATQPFKATGTYSDSSTRDLTAIVQWQSLKTGVATISAQGLAKAVAPGSAGIVASDGGVSGRTVLSVAASLAVTGISPATGSIEGGTPITIAGAGFVSGAMVTIGGTSATNVVANGSGTSITATTAKHAAGVVNVVVTNPDGKSAALTKVYTYASAATGILDIPFIKQYEGESTQFFDCGPASLGMVIQFYGLRPAALSSDRAFIEQIRVRTGNLDLRDTTFPELEQAITSYGLSSSEISLSSSSPDQQLQDIIDAANAGFPVIALIHGAFLGRQIPDHKPYGDHWVVIRGFSADGNTVYLNDADRRTPAQLQAVGAGPDWINGGKITLPVAQFRDALSAAQKGPHALIVHKSA